MNHPAPRPPWWVFCRNVLKSLCCFSLSLFCPIRPGGNCGRRTSPCCSLLMEDTEPQPGQIFVPEAGKLGQCLSNWPVHPREALHQPLHSLSIIGGVKQCSLRVSLANNKLRVVSDQQQIFLPPMDWILWTPIPFAHQDWGLLNRQLATPTEINMYIVKLDFINMCKSSTFVSIHDEHCKNIVQINLLLIPQKIKSSTLKPVEMCLLNMSLSQTIICLQLHSVAFAALIMLQWRFQGT